MTTELIGIVSSKNYCGRMLTYIDLNENRKYLKDGQPVFASPPPKTDAAVAAIKYALNGDEPMVFLRLWFQGDFDVIWREWGNVPDEVFIGADPLFVRKTITG